MQSVHRFHSNSTRERTSINVSAVPNMARLLTLKIQAKAMKTRFVHDFAYLCNSPAKSKIDSLKITCKTHLAILHFRLWRLPVTLT